MTVTYPCPHGKPHEHYQGVSYTCGVKPRPESERRRIRLIAENGDIIDIQVDPDGVLRIQED